MKIKRINELNDNYKLKSVKKTIFEVDYGDLEDFINEIYGGNFEFVAIQEANNYCSYTFDIPSKDIFFFSDEKERIRQGKYDRDISVYQILQCLYEDGFLEAGEYLVNVSW